MKHWTWTKEQDDLVISLASRGATRRHIAGRVGCSEGSVKHRLKRLGVTLQGTLDREAVAANISDYVHYDQATGQFEFSGIRDYKGATFMHVAPDRVTIHLCGGNYQAAHIAVLCMTGAWPKGEIAYADKDPKNLKWSNLIDVTRSQQNAGHGLSKRNTSGFKGVSWDRTHRKWFAKITHKRRQIYLGLFDSAERAHDAYCAAGVKLFGPHFKPATRKTAA